MTADAVLVPVVFGWLGMVLAISFIEAPLKFRAPNVTLQIGLGIGRIVFRALNAVEAVLAITVVVLLVLGIGNTTSVVLLAVAVVVLAVQLAVVRPALTRRSDAVLAGAEGPRSHAHLWYVGFESVKVLALLAGGILVAARLG